jgi:hypothetical protein
MERKASLLHGLFSGLNRKWLYADDDYLEVLITAISIPPGFPESYLDFIDEYKDGDFGSTMCYTTGRISYEIHMFLGTPKRSL